MLSTMNHRPLSNQTHPSHLLEAYQYVHDICVSKYQIIQICHKNVLMNKYQKVLKDASQTNALQLFDLSLCEIFFALFWDKKK